MLCISQKAFADKVVDTYGVGSGIWVPASTSLKLDQFDADEPEGGWPFREVIGSLMWLANQTRPDISNAVRAVARYCHAPKHVHWKAALNVVWYLKSTSESFWDYFSAE